MLSFSVLSSGSKGNALIAKSADACVLIDCGISYRNLERRLGGVGVRPDDIDAVFITHEHTDHVFGLPQFLKKNSPIVCCSEGTYLGASHYFKSSSDRMALLRPGTPFQFRDINVDVYSTPHDAIDPIAIFLSVKNITLGVVTDLGEMIPVIRERAKTTTALLLEANHDVQMLADGPYPTRLKKRILGRYGHLSNDAASEFLHALSESRAACPEIIVGAHLSETNNIPQLVSDCFEEAWSRGGHSRRPKFVVGSRHQASELFTIS